MPACHTKPIFSAVGKPYPLGVECYEEFVNFSLYSKDATQVTLHLYDDMYAQLPCHSFILDSSLHKQGHYWCIRIYGIGHGVCYTYQVDGPWKPKQGLKFDPRTLLIDPYSTGVYIPPNYQRIPQKNDCANHDTCMKSVITSDAFDWQGVTAPNHPLASTLIYEMHVVGFTKDPSSKVEETKRGTFAGLIDKIPYLKSLGITAVELMPIQQFDVFDAPEGRENYWGYSPINFFSVHSEYSVEKSPIAAINEFKTLVRELHRNGIEVILDVVFNHTAEGDENGPTFCFKGLQNDDYYILEQSDPSAYANYSGCGNTCNANHSVFRRMVLDALYYWVKEMHVDGFRFDLASVLSRDSNGIPLSEPPLLMSIDSDPVLSNTKIIAEAWDAAGLYQVGSFIGDRWNEWNGKYRDDVRAFWRGDQNMVSKFSNRILGSPDIYHQDTHSQHRSVNFICAHDGFTLHDLVSYEHKHNFDNGEQNRDGENHNLSANYGVEGPTDDEEIKAIRLRQCKNMLATLFFSLGTPMLNMGDEVLRTQKGNNNAYCQNNEISWFDWKLVRENANLVRFVSLLRAIRSSETTIDWNLHRSLEEVLSGVNINWHGVELNQPDWSTESHSIALFMVHPLTGDQIYMIFNAYWNSLEFEIPHCKCCQWHMLVNTAEGPLKDIYLYENAPEINQDKILVKDRSMVVLVAKPMYE
ncbi:MAG: glycogen debranching protein GlgX [Vibrio sp.]